MARSIRSSCVLSVAEGHEQDRIEHAEHRRVHADPEPEVMAPEKSKAGGATRCGRLAEDWVKT